MLSSFHVADRRRLGEHMSEDRSTEPRRRLDGHISEGHIPETRAAEERAFETRIAEERAFETRAAEERAFEARVAEERAFEARVAEERAFEMRVAEERAFETRAVEEHVVVEHDVVDGCVTEVGVTEARAAATDQPRVSLTLSRGQIDHIMRSVLGEGADPSMSGLINGAGFHQSYARQTFGAKYRALQGNRRLSRSLLSGLLVLSCFTPEGIDLGIKDISEELDLNASTVHRYVLTLVAAGLLERDPNTRRYRLLPE
jgi:colicin import membrane protein